MRRQPIRGLLDAASLVPWLAALLLLAPGTCALAASEDVVLVIKSDDLPQYAGPIAAFRTGFSAEPLVVVDIEGSREHGTELLRSAASGKHVEGIFALGGQAAYLSRSLLPEPPLVFSMVLGWSRFRFAPPTTGVAVEIPVEALFTRFKLLLPQLNRLGVIHSSQTPAATLEQARRAARELGIALFLEDVSDSEEVPGAYRRIRSEIDALWMVPDPVVVTRDNFRYLSNRTRKDGVAFLAFSENFVRAGALLSVAPSYRTMGVQAAVLLDRILRCTHSLPPVQAPLGSRLVINSATAHSLGIELTANVLDMADLVINGPEKTGDNHLGKP